MEEFKSCSSREASKKIEHDYEWISSDALKIENHSYCSLNTSESSVDSEIIFAKPNEVTRKEMLLWLTKEKEDYQKEMKKIIECSFRDSKDMMEIHCRTEKIEKMIMDVSSLQKISKCEKNKGLESLMHEPQKALGVKLFPLCIKLYIKSRQKKSKEKAKIFFCLHKDQLENLRNLFPKIYCDHRTSSSSSNEINKDMERIIELLVERKVENLINGKFMKLKIQMKNQISELNLKEMSMSEKLNKLEENFKLAINENERLHELILINKNETEAILAQSKENKIMFDSYMTEKLAKKTAQISELKIKLENYSSDYYFSLENLPRFKKMKKKLLKKFNVENILMVKSHVSHYPAFENYIAIYNEISDKLDKFIEEFSFDKKYIYGVNRNQNQTSLFIYNAETHKKCTTIIGTPIPLSIYTCIAKLPNNKLFCYGSWEPLSGVACIIDLKSKTLKRSLPDGIPSIASGAVYHNNCIYVFGQSTTCSDALTLARKFDLEEDSWKDLTNLPVGAYYCSCIVFKGSILLSGWHHSHLYKYSTRTNDYEVVFSNLVRNYKIILKIKQRIYILQINGESYESEKGNEYLWNKISTNGYSEHRNSLITYNNGSALISLQEHNGMHCYKFSLKDKNIQKLE